MPPESVLALDTGMATGWAFHDRTGVVCGTQIFIGKEPGDILSRFGIWIADQLDEMRPEIIVYERPMATAKTINGMEMRFAMIGEIWRVAHLHERAWKPLAISTIKKAATGNGRASKDDMLTAARGMGWSPATDHEADALWMAHYAMNEIQVRRGKAA